LDETRTSNESLSLRNEKKYRLINKSKGQYILSNLVHTE